MGQFRDRFQLARTQYGNNNAYCQDNATTWTDWSASADPELQEFVANLAALRRRLPVLRQSRWLTGEAHARGRPDCLWWHPAGRPMTVPDWHDTGLATVGMWLSSTAERDVLCWFHRGAEALPVTLPAGAWVQRCATAAGHAFASEACHSVLTLAGRSVVLLELQND